MKQLKLFFLTIMLLSFSSAFGQCTLIDGPSFNSTVKHLVNPDVHLGNDQITKSIRFVTNSKLTSETVVSAPGSSAMAYVVYDSSIAKVSIHTSASGFMAPANFSSAFKDFYELTTISGLEEINTENVTSMNSLFGSCQKLTSFDISKFNTSNVTDMTSMFHGCDEITSLDLRHFDTAKVTSMKYMFCDCNKLSSLDVSSFDTSKVTDMGGMFDTCRSLSTIDVSNFNTGNVTDMSFMFGSCNNLSFLKIGEAFTMDKVTNKHSMFYLTAGESQNCLVVCTPEIKEAVTEQIVGLNPSFFTWNTSAGKCALPDGRSLNEAIKKLVTPSAKYSNADYTINAIEFVPNNNFTDGTVVSASGSETLAYASYDSNTKKVTVYTYASEFIAPADFSYAFNKFCSVSAIDLSVLNTLNVTSMTGMLAECSSLKSLTTGQAFTMDKVTAKSAMFRNTAPQSGTCNIRVYSKAVKDAMLEDTEIIESRFTWDVASSFCELLDGKSLNAAIKRLLNSEAGYEYYDESILGIKLVTGSAATSGTVVSVSNCNPKAYASYDSATKTVTIGTSASEFDAPADFSYAFYGFGTVRKIEGLSSLNTSSVRNMSKMFSDCSSLETIDVSDFDTKNVTDMSWMFFGCLSLVTIDASTFNTANVTNMAEMFGNLMSLTSLDFSHFNTANVTNMAGLFHETPKLTTLDLRHFDTANVTNMSDMFNGCSSLTSLKTSSLFTMDKVTNKSNMFYGLTPEASSKCEITCSDATKLSFRAYETGLDDSKIVWITRSTSCVLLDGNQFRQGLMRVTGGLTYFNQVKKITFLTDVSSLPQWNESNVVSAPACITRAIAVAEQNEIKIYTTAHEFVTPEDFSEAFDELVSLTEIQGLNKLNTENTTNMSYLFYCCSSLISVDLSSFNTTNVLNMVGMFKGCTSLESLDLSNFNTENVTSMASMFSNCTSLRSVNLSSFNTARVTHLGQMFYGCAALESLDLSTFNTESAQNMMNMFDGCTSLKSLDLSSFRTDDVTGMQAMFKGCSSLTSLVTSNCFRMDKVTSKDNMFNGAASQSQDCTITCSEPTKTMMLSGTGMEAGYFRWNILDGECTLLDGKAFNQTIKRLEHDDMSYTSVDDVIKGIKFVTNSNVVSGTVISAPDSDIKAYASIDNSTKIVTIYTSASEFVAPADFSSAFYNLERIAAIDNLSALNTKNVTDMTYLFFNCQYLESLDLSKFNTVKVTDMAGMFASCEKLTELDLSSFKTAEVKDMTLMFYFCTSLTSLVTTEDFVTDLAAPNTTTMLSYAANESHDCTVTCSGAARALMVKGPNVNEAYFKWNLFGGQCILLSGVDFNTEIKKLVNPEATYETVDSDIKKIEFVTNSSVTTAVDVSASDSYARAYAGYDSTTGKVTVYTSASEFTTPNNLAYMFSNFNKVEAIDNLTAFNTENATDMQNLFYGCRSLATIDLTNFNTEKVTRTEYMFAFLGENFTEIDFGYNNLPVTNDTFHFSSWTESLTVRCTMAMKNVMVERKKYLGLDLSKITWILVDGTYNLVDGETYTNAEDSEYDKIAYTRTFTEAQVGKWQALYVPFQLDYSDWSALDLDVATITNFHEYANASGEVTKVELEVRYVKDGKRLRANTPYLIRAKSAGEKTIVTNNGKLYKAEQKSISCSSTERTYTFTGTNAPIAGIRGKGYIYLSGGKLCMSNDDDQTLEAQRWYLTIEDRGAMLDEVTSPAFARAINIRVVDDDAETTGIEDISIITSRDNDGGNARYGSAIYDLNGRKQSALRRGVNIVRQADGSVRKVMVR